MSKSDTSLTEVLSTGTSKVTGMEIPTQKRTSDRTETSSSSRKIISSFATTEPTEVGQEADEYVFSVKGKNKFSSVVIVLDVQQETVRARIRRINKALRQASQR